MTDDEIPYEVQQAKEYASSAAECIRRLNHLTLPHEGYPGLEYPSSVYDIVGALETAMGRMPQLLRQLAGWLEDEGEAGRVAHASGADPADAVANSAEWLKGAAGPAGNLAEQLHYAYNALSPLKGNT